MEGLNFDEVDDVDVVVDAQMVPMSGASAGEVVDAQFEAVLIPMSEGPLEGRLVPVVGLGLGLDLEVVRPKFDDFKRSSLAIAKDATALVVKDEESLNRAASLGGLLKGIASKVETMRKATIAGPQEFIDGVNKICAIITDPLVTKKNSKKEITNPSCAENVLKGKIAQHQAKVELDRRERERKAAEEAAALQRRLDAEAAAANRKAAEEARVRAEADARAKAEADAEEARKRGADAAAMEALRKNAAVEVEAAGQAAVVVANENAIQAPQVVAPVVQDAARVTRTEDGSAFSKRPWVFVVERPDDVPREFLVVDEKKIRDAVKMGTRAIAGVKIYQDTQINFKS